MPDAKPSGRSREAPVGNECNLADHVLVLVPLHSLEVLGDRTPRHGDAIAVKIPVIEKRPHQEWNAPSLEHIFGDITATGFQIGDIWCPFEDLRHVEEIELQAAFV